MLGSLFESVDKKIEMICKETKNVKQLRALLKRNKNVNINMLDFVSLKSFTTKLFTLYSIITRGTIFSRSSGRLVNRSFSSDRRFS